MCVVLLKIFNKSYSKTLWLSKKASNGDPKYFITMLSGLFVERPDADKEGIWESEVYW